MSWLIALLIAASRRRRPSESTTKGVGSPDTYAYTAVILAATREEIDRADHKAAILLAGSGVGVGAVLAGLLAGDWSPFELSNAIEWLWWVGVVLTAIAVASLGAALYPRIERRGPFNLVAYYGDVLAYTAVDELVMRLQESAASSVEGLADQLRQGSRIVNRKYRLIRASLWLLSAAVLCYTISVLVNVGLG